MIRDWVFNQEKQAIEKRMKEVIAYIHQDVEPDQSGKTLFTISDDVPQNLVTPKFVTKRQLV